jgi:two-component system sensor histidine kinase HydH
VKPARAQEWGVLAVAGGLAALLMASSVSSFVAARELTDALVRGEGELMFHGLREWLPRGRPPGPEELRAFHGRWQEQGLRYVALFGPRAVVIASAGEPAAEPPNADTSAGAPQWIGAWGEEVVRIDRPLGPPPEAREEPEGAGPSGQESKGAGPEGQPGEREEPDIAAVGGLGAETKGEPRPRRGPLVRLEYEPRLATEVRQRALRDLIVCSTVAAVLVIAALVFQRVRRRTRANADELAKRRHLAALGEMSAVLAHEIRNPLASLKGHAQLLEEQLAGEERKVAKARRIVEEAGRLEALTNTLLDFVRAQQIKRRTTDPRALARRAAELTDAARVEVDDARAPAEFQLDGMRVEQALVNLLRNALQVSPPGTPVQIKVAQESGGLSFVVSDRGAGVPKELRERIFEPFVSGRTQGTGLGLAVVRRVAELHGGRAEVADRPGGGSQFSLWLPAETPGG